MIVVVGSRRRLNQGAERPGAAELAGVNLPGFNPYGIIKFNQFIKINSTSYVFSKIFLDCICLYAYTLLTFLLRKNL